MTEKKDTIFTSGVILVIVPEITEKASQKHKIPSNVVTSREAHRQDVTGRCLQHGPTTSSTIVILQQLCENPSLS